MGFRSTFVTMHWGITWPAWFVEKYQERININSSLLTPKLESKEYEVWKDLAKDIQRAIDWEVCNKFKLPFVLIWLHECGGITRVRITQEKIDYTEPSEWMDADGVQHWYCGNCAKD